MNNYFEYSSNAINTNEYVKLEKDDKRKFTFSNSVNMKPNDVFALARAFLSIAPMTHKKLEKLCYYAKAWYLAIYDRNLISEPFEAWVHGAVQPKLYKKYKVYGFSDIPKEHNITNIPEEFISFANEIYSAYGHLSGDELERLNHMERPWKEARGDCKPWENCNSIITEDSMRYFYRERLK